MFALLHKECHSKRCSSFQSQLTECGKQIYKEKKTSQWKSEEWLTEQWHISVKRFTESNTLSQKYPNSCLLQVSASVSSLYYWASIEEFDVRRNSFRVIEMQSLVEHSILSTEEIKNFFFFSTRTLCLISLFLSWGKHNNFLNDNIEVLKHLQSSAVNEGNGFLTQPQ